MVGSFQLESDNPYLLHERPLGSAAEAPYGDELLEARPTCSSSWPLVVLLAPVELNWGVFLYFIGITLLSWGYLQQTSSSAPTTRDRTKPL